MSDEHRISLLLNLAPGPNDESPVSNTEQLESFGRYGVWVRALTAYRLVSANANRSEVSLPQVSTVVGLYEQFGMFYEDIISTVAAWGGLNRNPNLLIADLLERIVITGQEQKGGPAHPTYHDSVFETLASSTQRVRINPVQLVDSLSALSEEKILHELGIQWKKHPSVKYVARDKQAEWLKLPALASHLFDSIRDQKASLLSISYNKLKHGPQFIVADPIVSATRRGHSPEQSDREFMNHCYVRVLHQGARTQEEDREFQGGRRAAPFLVGKPEILRKLLFGTMVFTANGMFILTDWKFRRLSGRHLELPGDPLWKSMIEEGARRLENVTPAF